MKALESSAHKSASVTDNVKLAVLAMVLTNLNLSIADAVIKSTISDMPLSQFVVLRSCLTIPLLILFVRFLRLKISLVPIHLGWATVRSSLLLLSLLAYYASLPRLDFSVAAAVYYTIPLFITLFSACLIREPVGASGWIAVTIGFVGVLLMLKPQADDFNIYALLPLCSAILYALGMVLTRTKCKAENTLALALTFNVTAIVLGGAATLAMWVQPASMDTSQNLLVGSWVAMGRWTWGLIFLLSIAMFIGSVGTAFAYQNGPASIVSTFDFSYLAFAVLWGALFFAETLDAASFLGIVLIATAGVIVVRRKPHRTTRHENLVSLK